MKKLTLLIIMLAMIAGSSFAQLNTSYEGRPADFKTIWSEDYTSNNNNKGSCFFLVFRDNLPWNTTSVTDVLDANLENYAVLGSALMATMDFSTFDVIVIEGDQVPGFHSNFVASFAKFDAFVQAGGRLEIHACVGGWNSQSTTSVQLPGGAYTSQLLENWNDVAMPAHPVVAGVNNPFWGNMASHGVINNLVPGTEILATAQSNGLPTTIQYSWGTGTVIATTSPLEAAWDWGWNYGIMLENTLSYTCGYVPPGVPVSDWAIYLGIFLIATFMVFRYRRTFA